MKSFLIKPIVLSSLLCISSNLFAADQPTSFTYHGLYKTLKTASSSQYSQIKLNFYLLTNQDQKICPISQGFISDGDNSIDLSITKTGKMLLPLDHKLKQDRAAITIFTPEKDMCHLSMRVEVAQFELTNITARSINGWISQMNALYAELAGWPGRYFMPEVIGLNFKFEQDQAALYANSSNEQHQLIGDSTSNKVFLPLAAIAQLTKQQSFTYSIELISVTPQLGH